MPYDPANSGATGQQITKTGVGSRTVAITPGPADILPYPKIVEVISAGDLTYLPSRNDDGDTVTVTGAPVGYRTPVEVRQVTAATATLIGVYDV